MTYWYYPGCSLQGSAAEYDSSTRALMRVLAVELVEIDDWNCCGASAAEGVSELLALALPARTLALAERRAPNRDVMIPCSACYLNLKRVEVKSAADATLRQRLNQVLGAEGLEYGGRVRARHLLEVLAREVDLDSIKAKVVHSLEGLVVAPYYGCQCLRPYGDFDDPESPRSMEPLISALGAQVFSWSMGARCCGAGLMTTEPQVALQLTAAVLGAAKGADCIATVCPMCQLNLEGYQGKIGRLLGEAVAVDVIYLPQLMGAALGIEPHLLQLDANLALSQALRRRLAPSLSR